MNLRLQITLEMEDAEMSKWLTVYPACHVGVQGAEINDLLSTLPSISQTGSGSGEPRLKISKTTFL